MRDEMQVVFNKLTDKITGFDVYVIGDEVHLVFDGTRGFAPNIEIRLSLESAKTLTALMVAAVRKAESQRRLSTRIHMRHVMDYLPENLSWLLEG